MMKRLFYRAVWLTMMGMGWMPGEAFTTAGATEAASPLAEQQAASPVLPIRELYAPGHFGNR
jgi:hypothetical protein